MLYEMDQEDSLSFIRGVVGGDPRWKPCRIIGMASPARQVNCIYVKRPPEREWQPLLPGEQWVSPRITLVAEPFVLEADTSAAPGAMGADISTALFEVLKPNPALGLRQLVGIWRRVLVDHARGMVQVAACTAVEG